MGAVLDSADDAMQAAEDFVFDKIVNLDAIENLFRVRWEGYDAGNDTWEPTANPPFNAARAFSRRKKQTIPEQVRLELPQHLRHVIKQSQSSTRLPARILKFIRSFYKSNDQFFRWHWHAGGASVGCFILFFCRQARLRCQLTKARVHTSPLVVFLFFPPP